MTVTNPAPATQRRHVGDVVGEVAGTYITELQRGYRNDVGSAVAMLAQLRRGAGKLPTDVPELWGLTGTDRLYRQAPQLETDETAASRAEAALFLALTLYALHQQSRPDRDMHKPGAAFGAAVRRLMGEEVDEPIRKRFAQIGASSTAAILADRLRGMVKLLRAESIPLDYAQLTAQLYRAQLPGGLTQVRRVWGRGFHAYQPPTTGSTTQVPGNGEPTTDEETS
ncbi:type I-E CRISPR-associated protein Cse2/CasB [Actinomadura sp. DC4]|uniref:type I-E CRISPR-associated protein Cse2/CasB n=1 Tax=Actinomadura sp. DC4 TaxID=3055069 RepID=UPI0025B1FA83|nr:type I-E CRISPR-associated protein Cse2/CasB [Actinomadura sp. DC4]MDN3357335.1 type I-E CRISPR-associated protein Cse2/CasB [Actinomadura sp. DC4]